MFAQLKSLFANDIGIDLGTANSLVYVRDQGIVLREPSVVAIQAGTTNVLAVAEEAKRMLVLTPGNIVAIRPMTDDTIADFEVKGRDLSAGLPKTLTVRSEEIREALKEPLTSILESIRITLERCPPELSADLVDRGIVMAGGGSLLRCIDRLVAEETGLPVHIADDPLTAVAEGTGRVLQELQFLKRVASSSRT